MDADKGVKLRVKGVSKRLWNVYPVRVKFGHFVAQSELLCQRLLPRVLTWIRTFLLSEILEQPVPIEIAKNRPAKAFQLDDGGVAGGYNHKVNLAMVDLKVDHQQDVGAREVLAKLTKHYSFRSCHRRTDHDFYWHQEPSSSSTIIAECSS
jgi:hypothetical protein